MRDLVIGVVGKPSAGKSTFFNAATGSQAKVGNYPFTTIEPNQGVSSFLADCPCARLANPSDCKPRFGQCKDGKRLVPVKLLDVAGLVPGASEGLGIGNKFLDDLRHADCLCHIVDVSGTTNEKGETTTGYDPINDIEWLRTEIHSWIFNNLWKKWPSLVRRHQATSATVLETLQMQFSGYGADQKCVQRALDRAGVKEPAHMEAWEKERLEEVVTHFMDTRFPTLYVLNKIDSPDSDRNISKICDKYGSQSVALCSGLAECFLQRMRKQGYVLYTNGADDFLCRADHISSEGAPEGFEQLKEPDDKVLHRLNRIRDMVLYRYGGTGVIDAVSQAVQLTEPVLAFPVKDIRTFTCGKAQDGIFCDCVLLKAHTTFREFAQILHPEIGRHFAYAEVVGGQRRGGEEEITKENQVFRIVTQVEENVTIHEAVKKAEKK